MELLMKHSHFFKEVNHGVNLILSLARVPGSPVSACEKYTRVHSLG